MGTGIIYKYTSPSGKIYIGQTIDEHKRRNKFFNLKESYAGAYINNARKKYGPENFKYEVLVTTDQSNLDRLEKYYIKLFKSDCKEFGYNLTIGGGGTMGYTMSEEERLKRSILNKERNIKPSAECIELATKAKLGKHRTEETKKKISESIKKISYTEEQIKYRISKAKAARSIAVIEINSNVVYESAGQAAQLLNIDASHITKCCKGKANSVKGYKFKYKIDNNEHN